MTYAAEVLADSPEAYWRLGEPNEFFNAADESGNGNTGIYVGPPTLPVAGLIPADGDTAVEFDATSQDQYVIGTTDLGNTTYPAFSFEVLIQHTDLTAGQTLIAMGLQFESSNVFSLHSGGFSGSDITYEVIWSGTGGYGGGFVPDALPGGVPHHFAVTYNGASTKIYVDGALVRDDETVNGALDFGGVAANLFVGGDDQGVTGGIYGTGGGFNGTLDEAAFYTHALSAARVLAHANAAGFFPPDENPPQVDNITPDYGIIDGGDVIILTGAHFAGVTSIYFGGDLAPDWTIDSDTQITVTTPAHIVGSVQVDVSNDFGTDSESSFDYTIDGEPPPGPVDPTSDCIVVQVPGFLADGSTADGDGIVYTPSLVGGWWDSIPLTSATAEVQPRGETITVAQELGREIALEITAHSPDAGVPLGPILCFTAMETIKAAFRTVFVPSTFRVVDPFADRTLLARRVGPIKQTILGDSAVVQSSIPLLGEDPRRFPT